MAHNSTNSQKYKGKSNMEPTMQQSHQTLTVLLVTLVNTALLVVGLTATKPALSQTAFHDCVQILENDLGRSDIASKKCLELGINPESNSESSITSPERPVQSQDLVDVSKTTKPSVERLLLNIADDVINFLNRKF